MTVCLLVEMGQKSQVIERQKQLLQDQEFLLLAQDNPKFLNSFLDHFDKQTDSHLKEQEVLADSKLEEADHNCLLLQLQQSTGRLDVAQLQVDQLLPELLMEA